MQESAHCSVDGRERRGVPLSHLAPLSKGPGVHLPHHAHDDHVLGGSVPCLLRPPLEAGHHLTLAPATDGDAKLPKHGRTFIGLRAPPQECARLLSHHYPCT